MSDEIFVGRRIRVVLLTVKEEPTMVQGTTPKQVANRLRTVLAILILPALLLALFTVSFQESAQGAANSLAAVSHAEAATPAAILAAAGEPPHIKHDIAGRENCLLCHNPEGNIKPAPKNHIGRKVDICQGCHKRS